MSRSQNDMNSDFRTPLLQRANYITKPFDVKLATINDKWNKQISNRLPFE